MQLARTVVLAGSVDEESPMSPDEIAWTMAAMEEIERFEMTDEERPAIEADRGHQVLVELLRPLRVVQRREPTARCARAAKDIHQNVDAAKLS